MRPIIIGIIAAFFFAVTFVLNRAMALSGENWTWSASLRYFFTIPFLLAIVLTRRNLRPLLGEMKRSPFVWLLWSTVGFGLFYAPLCFSSEYGPGWLVAGTWQITIVAGALLSPLFFSVIETEDGPIKVRGKVPVKGLAASVIILAGIALMQWGQAGRLSPEKIVIGAVPIILAAFAYPLGNRKMMEFTGKRLDTFQRVLGMTFASLPFWLLLSIYGWCTSGPPGLEQMVQSAIVAVSAGVIATVLFFYATELVKSNIQKLASVEATQSMEVVFALIGELALLNAAAPSFLSWLGILLVVAGMVIHSYISQKSN